MNQYDPNNWYDRNGVSRPQTIPFLTEEELEKKFAKIREETVHGDWKQKGNMIFCGKCNPTHGDSIPVKYLLLGTDKQGLPILKPVDL